MTISFTPGPGNEHLSPGNPFDWSRTGLIRRDPFAVGENKPYPVGRPFFESSRSGFGSETVFSSAGLSPGMQTRNRHPFFPNAPSGCIALISRTHFELFMVSIVQADAGRLGASCKNTCTGTHPCPLSFKGMGICFGPRREQECEFLLKPEMLGNNNFFTRLSETSGVIL